MRCLWIIVALALELVAAAQPARIILIRHAEKPADALDPHLTVIGRERAQALVKWAARPEVLGTNGPLAALYAARPSAHQRGERCVETLQPLEQELKLSIRTPWLARDFQPFARALLTDESLRGRTVLVCWTHEEIPDLVAALGVTPKPAKWKSEDFQTAYLITLGGVHPKLEHLKQRYKPRR